VKSTATFSSVDDLLIISGIGEEKFKRFKTLSDGIKLIIKGDFLPSKKFYKDYTLLQVRHHPELKFAGMFYKGRDKSV
jgi:hypothetical protein